MKDLQIKAYKKNPVEVEAINVTEENLYQIFEYLAENEASELIMSAQKGCSKVIKFKNENSNLVVAGVGDYLVYGDGDTIRAMSADVFEADFIVDDYLIYEAGDNKISAKRADADVFEVDSIVDDGEK